MLVPSCTICSSTFLGGQALLSTKCGHVFHEACVLQHMDNNQSCPECYSNVSRADFIKLFLNFTYITSDSSPTDPVEPLNEKVKQKGKINNSNIDKKNKHSLRKANGKIGVLIKTKYRLLIQLQRYKKKLSHMQEIENELERVKYSYYAIWNELLVYHNSNIILSGSQDYFNYILGQMTEMTDVQFAVRILSFYCGVLRRQLDNFKNINGYLEVAYKADLERRQNLLQNMESNFKKELIKKDSTISQLKLQCEIVSTAFASADKEVKFLTQVKQRLSLELKDCKQKVSDKLDLENELEQLKCSYSNLQSDLLAYHHSNFIVNGSDDHIEYILHITTAMPNVQFALRSLSIYCCVLRRQLDYVKNINGVLEAAYRDSEKRNNLQQIESNLQNKLMGKDTISHLKLQSKITNTAFESADKDVKESLALELQNWKQKLWKVSDIETELQIVRQKIAVISNEIEHLSNVQTIVDGCEEEVGTKQK